MSAIAAASPQLWGAVGSLGGRIRRGLDATNWKAAAGIFATIAGLKAVLARAGLGAAIAGLVFALVVFAVVVGRRRFPQAAGVIAASATSVLAVLTASLASIAVSGLPIVPWSVILSVPMLIIVTAAVFVAPHRGVHVGWSVAIAQGCVVASLPLAVCAPTNDWLALAALGSFVLALIGVYFRSRHAEAPVGGRWKRWGRRFAVGAVSMLAALTVLLGAPGSASAMFGIGDMMESIKNDMLCSFTRPDLTQQGVGTGPESMLPSRNFGQVGGLRNPNEIPQYSDQIGNFDRLGPNQSLDNYTLYEIAGLRGIKFINWQKNDSGEELCSIMPWISVTSGNMVMSLNTYILQVVITLKEMSQSGRPFEFLYDKTIPLVDTLFNGLFLPAAALMFVLLGIALLARALGSGNGFRGALGDVGGTAAILIFGGFLFGGLSAASWSNPNTNGFFFIGSLLDTAAASVNSATAEASFKALDLGGTASLCKEPRPVPAGPGQDESYAAAAPGQRYSSCILAEGLAYRPWALGQFGSAGNNQIPTAEKTTRFGDPRVSGRSNLIQSKTDPKGQGLPCYNNYIGCTDMRSYLIAQEGGPSFDAARKACMQDEGDYAHLVQCDPYHAVAGQLTILEKSNKPGVKNTASTISRSYHGEGLFPHLTQAIVALIATAIVAAGVGAISILSLWWQFMLLILFITGVPRLLYAAFPGKASAGKEYGADFVSTFVQRIGFGLLSLAMIAGVALIFGAPMAMGMKIFATALLMFGMMRSFKKIQEAMKVKGSTMSGPAENMQRNVTLGAGYLGFKAGGMALKGAGATVRGAGKGTKWAVTKKKPSMGEQAYAGAAPGAAPGGVVAAGPLKPNHSPIRRATTGAAKGVGKTAAVTGAVAGAGAAAAGRGARAVSAPLHRVSAFSADRVAQGVHGAGQATSQRAKATARKVDRALGAKLPVKRVAGEATKTASEFGRRAVGNGRERIESTVSYLTPRAYADYLSPEFKDRADARRTTSLEAGNTYRARSFSEWERGRDFENLLYKANKVQRRGGAS